jgi:hypothetical protein
MTEERETRRTRRSADERDADVRKLDTADEFADREWVNPRELLTPPHKDGIKYRWIRTAMVGQADTKNVSAKLREGWVPVSAEEFPDEFHAFRSDSGHIEYGGLMLCKTSEKIVAQRNAHYNRIAQNQITAVDNNMMRQSDPRMPLSSPERTTREGFGRGRG